MTPEQQLIQQIQQVLAAPQIERNGTLEDMALQFTEMCEAVNTRLLQCEDYLNKGMRSEAVQEAHNLPDILEFSNLLKFDGLKKWRNLCTDLELSVFPPLNQEALSHLEKAIEIERELAPLLGEYRRNVYQGNHRGCIETLRKILAKDSENPSWKTNLQPLEEEELPGILANAERVLAKGDLVFLSRIYDELNHPQRVVKPPEEIMHRIRHALLSERSAELKDDAEALLQRLQAGMTAQDVVDVEVALSKLTELEKDEAFLERPTGWDSFLSKGREYLENQAKRREKQAEFLKAVDEMQLMLSKGTFTEMELRHEWERLLAWELPVSELLKQQVAEALSDLALRKRRRARHILFGSIALLLVVLAVGVIVGLRQNRLNREMTTISHLEGLIEQGKFYEAADNLENLRKADVALSEDPRVEELRRQVQDFLSREKGNKESFARAWGNLVDIQNSGYTGSQENIQQALTEATTAANALKDKDMLAKIRGWRSQWNDFVQRQQENATNEVKLVVTAVRSALSEQQKHPYSDFDAESQKIAQLKEKMSAVKGNLEQAGEKVKNEYQECQEGLLAWERECARRVKAFHSLNEELAKLRESIPREANDLGVYKEALKRYIELAPDSDPVKRSYTVVLKNFKDYEGIPAGEALSSVELPLTSKGYAQAQKLMKEKLTGTIWETDVSYVLSYYAKNQQLIKGTLALLNDNANLLKLYSIKYREAGSERWKRLYLPKMLNSKPDPENETIKMYWGSIYVCPADGGAPYETHTNKVFTVKRLDSENYEFEIDPRDDGNRSEYAKFLYNFVSKVSNQKNVPGYLLQGIEQVVKNPELETVLKVLIVKRILNLLVVHYEEICPELRELNEKFVQLNTDIPWMDEETVAVQALSEKLDAIVVEGMKIQVMQERLNGYYRLMSRVFGFGVKCIGSCQMTEDGKIVLVPVATGAKEIWGLFHSGAGLEPALRVVSVNGVDFLPDMSEKCLAGMPLFAPRSGRGVWGGPQNLGVNPDKIEKPIAWPENAWK